MKWTEEAAECFIHYLQVMENFANQGLGLPAVFEKAQTFVLSFFLPVSQDWDIWFKCHREQNKQDSGCTLGETDMNNLIFFIKGSELEFPGANSVKNV